MGRHWSEKKPFLFLIILVELARCFYSMTYYRDVDYHCYKKFAEIFISSRDFDYRTYICDYGKMYYPGLFIYIYSILVFFTGDSNVMLQLVHVSVHLLITLLSLKVFGEFYGKRYRWLVIIQPFLVQTIYKVGISYITNDIYSSLFIILTLYSLKVERYSLSSLVYTMSVSYKMNALLYGFPLLLTYLHSMSSLFEVFCHFLAMGIYQILIALPFLVSNFEAYREISFNFSREFDNIQNIAWSFLGDKLRRHYLFYKLLLFFTLFTLFLFLYRIHNLYMLLKQAKLNSKKKKKLLTWIRLFTLVGGNFVCFAFVRGVHVQFSLWIWFSLLFLLTSVLENEAWIILVYLSLDFCLGHPRNVLILSWEAFKNLVRWKSVDRSVLGRIPDYYDLEKIVLNSTLNEKNWVAINGHYYQDKYGLCMIPCSFVLFVIECYLLTRIFGKLRKVKKEIEGRKVF